MTGLAPAAAPRVEVGRFLITGGIGFLLDAGVLSFLVLACGFNPYLARVASFAVAVTGTWICNRYWTFGARRSGGRKAEYIRYVIVQIAGAAINFGVYGALIHAGFRGIGYPVLQLAAGAAISMFFTFVAMKRYVFRG